MADVGTLAVVLSADPKAFESGMDRAAASSSRFAQITTAAGKSVEAALTAIEAHPVMAILGAALAVLTAASAVTVGAFYGVRKELIALNAEGSAAAVEQAGLSRKFGLAADAAGGLSLAMQSFGVDQGAVTKGAIHLNEKISEGAAGTGAAAKVFQRLGLDAAALAKVPLDQQLGKIGDALKAVHDPGERMHLQWVLLGRHGRELEQIMKLGSAGMADMADKSKRWGLTFSAADAAALKSAALAEKQADIALGSVRQGFANQIASAFAPMRQLWAEFEIGFIDFAEPVLGRFRMGLAGAGLVFLDITDGIRQAWMELAPIFAEVGGRLQDALGGMAGAFGTSTGWRDVVRGIAFAVTDIAGTIAVGIVEGVVRVVDTMTLWHHSVVSVASAIQGAMLNAFNKVADALIGLLKIAAKLPKELGGDMFQKAAVDAIIARGKVRDSLGGGIFDGFKLPAMPKRPGGGPGGGGEFAEAGAPPRLPSADVMGSAAAISAVNQAQSQQANPQQQMLALAQKADAREAEQALDIRRLREIQERGGNFVIGEIAAV